MTDQVPTLAGPWLSADDYNSHVRIPNGCMTVLPEFKLTLPNGRVYRFEWHSCLGPTFLRKDGEPLARYPGQRNPMWRAFTAWDQQGRKVDAEGNCLWSLSGKGGWKCEATGPANA